MLYSFELRFIKIDITTGRKIMSGRPSHGEFCWSELLTSDVKKAKEFYEKLLGWSHEDHQMKDMTYTMFKKGESLIGGLMQIPADKEDLIPPHWMSYILVDDLGETVEKAKNLGAEIKVSEKEVEGMGKLAVIKDPSGAHIAFWEPKKSQ